MVGWRGFAKMAGWLAQPSDWPAAPQVDARRMRHEVGTLLKIPKWQTHDAGATIFVSTPAAWRAGDLIPVGCKL